MRCAAEKEEVNGDEKKSRITSAMENGGSGDAAPLSRMTSLYGNEEAVQGNG